MREKNRLLAREFAEKYENVYLDDTDDGVWCLFIAWNDTVELCEDGTRWQIEHLSETLEPLICEYGSEEWEVDWEVLSEYDDECVELREENDLECWTLIRFDLLPDSGRFDYDLALLERIATGEGYEQIGKQIGWVRKVIEPIALWHDGTLYDDCYTVEEFEAAYNDLMSSGHAVDYFDANTSFSDTLQGWEPKSEEQRKAVFFMKLKNPVWESEYA